MCVWKEEELTKIAFFPPKGERGKNRICLIHDIERIVCYS